MKNLPCFPIKFLILVLFLSACGGSNDPRPVFYGGSSEDGRIEYYDIYFEINPGQRLFRSKQSITLDGDLSEDSKLTFWLGQDLVVDALILQDGEGNDLALSGWDVVDEFVYDLWWGKSVFSEIEIQARETITSDGQLVLELEYHLPSEVIHDELPENPYTLSVSTKGSLAGGPESGAFPLLSGVLEAPFEITIQHPNDIQCASPGELISWSEMEEYTTVSYQAAFPYDPSFSCAPYQVMAEEANGMRVEIFAPAHIELDPQMLATAIQVMDLYQENFAEPGTGSIRFVFLDLSGGKGGAESNGNAVFMADYQPFLDYELFTALGYKT